MNKVKSKPVKVNPHLMRDVNLRISEAQLRFLGAAVLNLVLELDENPEREKFLKIEGIHASIKERSKCYRDLFKEIEKQFIGSLDRPYIENNG